MSQPDLDPQELDALSVMAAELTMHLPDLEAEHALDIARCLVKRVQRDLPAGQQPAPDWRSNAWEPVVVAARDARHLLRGGQTDEAYDTLRTALNALDAALPKDTPVGSLQGSLPAGLVVDWTESGQGILLDITTDPATVVGTHDLRYQPSPGLVDAAREAVAAWTSDGDAFFEGVRLYEAMRSLAAAIPKDTPCSRKEDR